MFLRNSLKKEAIRTQDKENWATYKRIRNSTTKLIAEAKAEFYQTRLESNAKNPKEIWKTITNLMNRKDSKSTINEMTFDNKKVSDPQRSLTAWTSTSQALEQGLLLNYRRILNILKII